MPDVRSEQGIPVFSSSPGLCGQVGGQGLSVYGQHHLQVATPFQVGNKISCYTTLIFPFHLYFQSMNYLLILPAHNCLVIF